MCYCVLERARQNCVNNSKRGTSDTPVGWYTFAAMTYLAGILLNETETIAH